MLYLRTKNRWTLLILPILFLQLKLAAQPVANFSAAPVSGCSPVIVHFTDLSTGNPTQWRWDLGNGVISFLQNPSTSYFNPGTYNVILVVRNATGADTIIRNQLVIVYEDPVINFSASVTTGCFPLNVQFTDQSSAGSGTIANWAWDFGDGTTSTQANPSHIYTGAGNFTVTLKVTNSFGCTKAFSKNQYILITDGVQAGFTNNEPGNCSAPVTIVFANTTTGPGSLSYSWDFGDGTTSASTNPVHTYTSPGSYTVTLVASSPQGCTDTERKVNLITIGTIISQFNYPVSVCAGKSFILTNTTTPVPVSVLWDFGDGTFSAQNNPVKTYTTSGTYIIKLLNSYNGCKDSVSHSIFVSPKPVAAFISNDTMGCLAPFTANFINQSTGNTASAWNFGDGGTSAAVNPSHTYTITGNYTVTLIVTNAIGCKDTLVKTAYIKIQTPGIFLSGLPKSGCVPFTISPVAFITSNQSVAAYLWDFGDGTTSTLVNPSHTYNIAGTYTVSLTITTVGGCRGNIVFAAAVRTGNKPHAAFTAFPTTVCAFTPVGFTDQSITNVDQWLWTFGDGGTSASQNPIHAYTDTGYFNVTLVVWSNGCPDTLKINKMIRVFPPIAKFISNIDCINKYKKDFTDQSIGATGWLWDFGDGTTSSIQSPSHTYAATGNYTVKLIVSNDTCTNTKTQVIKVVDETANFSTVNSTFCKPHTAVFTGININAANIASWRWVFGDGTTASSTQTASHLYNVTGTFIVTLTITDILGCVSTKTMTVTVYGPKALFTSVAGACVGQSTIQFTDASTTDGTNALVKWVWIYGDGSTDSTGVPPYNHTYAAAGIYDVSLKVVDSYGCSDILVKTAAITIAKPTAGFNSPDTNSCTDKPVLFNNTSVGYTLKYLWSFGDGTNDTVANPVHHYSATGIYSVGLLVTDRYGCMDTVNKPGYINISFPKASFTISDSISFCPPLLVIFTDSSLHYTSLFWDFGDGNTSAVDSPSHYYSQPGIYFAKLVATGPGGCTDSMSRRIEVRGPSGNFTYRPLTGCDPLTVNFTANTLNSVSFTWDYSDGTIFATPDSIVSHTYNSPGDYIPKMILSDSTGCFVSVFGAEVINVKGVQTGFTLDQFRFCDSGYVNFTNTTVSNDFITSYQWVFGDGSFSNIRQPSHHYVIPGVYNVQLIAITQAGCTDTFALNDSVTVFISPVISITGDSVACGPSQFIFNGIVNRGNPALLNWNWNFNNGQVSTFQNPPVQTFTIAGLYIISSLVTDDHGCKDSVIKTINIYPIPVTDAGADAWVCRDSFVQLNATGASTYQWDASSSLSCTSCASPLAAPTDSTMYFVTGTTAFGCSSRDSVIIKVRQHLSLLVTPGDSICIGSSVRISATGADKYQWSPAAGLDNAGSPSPKASPTLTTLYTVTATDNDNCFTDTASVLIKVNAIPTVDAGPDITIAVGSAGQLRPIVSADVTGFIWTPAYNLSCVSCANPMASPKQTTQYSVRVVNSGGCASLDDLTVFVVCNNANLFIPNTFSPNGDGANEIFYPRGTGLYRIKSFRVYNRWGEIVFERINFNANDAAAGWDGTYKGQKLTTDVFVFSCEVICENNEVLLFKGDVTLLR